MRWLAGCLMCVGMVAIADDAEPRADRPGAAAEEPKPTHVEGTPIRFSLGSTGKLETIAMNRDGQLLAAVSWVPSSNQETAAGSEGDDQPQQPGGDRPGDSKSERPPDDAHPRRYALQTLSPSGELLKDWDLPEGIQGHAVHATDEGDIYVGGDGGLVRLNESGEEMQRREFATLLDGQYAEAHASGLSVNADYVFLALGEGRSLRATEDILRLKRDLTEPFIVAKQQFGCCSHVDLECRTGELLIAENSRHRVNRMTFDGELIERWGKRDRVGIEGFAACCNPVNIDLGADGALYTAESGIGRIKKYSPQGEFLGLVGYVDTTEFDRGSHLASISCYIPVEVSADGRRVYVMDIRQNLIRVLEQVATPVSVE